MSSVASRHRPPRGESQRFNVQLPVSLEEFGRFKAAASAEDGMPLGRWLVEAARAYRLLALRSDGVLTDDDWREVTRE